MNRSARAHAVLIRGKGCPCPPETILRKSLNRAQILELCVGDTLDQNRGRTAFPRTKAELVVAPQGQAMFDIAHQALVDIAKHIPSFAPYAKKPDKFCHGYGIFQHRGIIRAYRLRRAETSPTKRNSWSRCPRSLRPRHVTAWSGSRNSGRQRK